MASFEHSSDDSSPRKRPLDYLNSNERAPKRSRLDITSEPVHPAVQQPGLETANLESAPRSGSHNTSNDTPENQYNDGNAASKTTKTATSPSPNLTFGPAESPLQVLGSLMYGDPFWGQKGKGGPRGARDQK